MSVEELYKFWSEDPYFDEATRAELLSIKDDKKQDPNCKIWGRKQLAFG